MTTPADALELSRLPDDAGDLLLPTARTAIETAVGVPGATTVPDAPLPGWAVAPGASFATLTVHGRLRGCVGSLAADRPLLTDVAENAVAAATRDRRFHAVTADELPTLRITVTVLSERRPLPVADLTEACAALRPGVDGVVATLGHRHATFLPRVWEDLPDPAEFLARLWLKAGVVPGTWPDGTTLETYTTRSWSEVDPDGA